MTGETSAAAPDRATGRGRWALLAVGMAVALLTSALWLWLARFDGTLDYVDVSPGQSGLASGGSWQLVNLISQDTIATRYDDDKPLAGATFVAALLDADLRNADPDSYCDFDLVAGDLLIHADTSLGRLSPTSVCRQWGTAPMIVYFEVPIKALPDVSAVVVRTGDRRPLRLAGTLR